METVFTNELGNRISIRVENGPPLQDVAQAVITLAGPNSMTENTITMNEIDELLRLLAIFRGMRLVEHQGR